MMSFDKSILDPILLGMIRRISNVRIVSGGAHVQSEQVSQAASVVIKPECHSYRKNKTMNHYLNSNTFYDNDTVREIMK